jgi:plastocyanin
MPWTLELSPVFRFGRAAPAPGVRLDATFVALMGLPRWLMIGARYTPQSVAAPRPDEWEAFGRWAAAGEARGGPLDVTMQAGYSGAARSPDGELAVARWFGPLRVSGAARVLGNAYGSGETRFGAGAGVVLRPRSRSMPLSITADAVTLFDRADDGGERVAWSVGANIGIPFSTHTAGLFVTNTASGSLQGTTLGGARTRIGVTFTAPLAMGQLLGLVVPREAAMDAVTTDAPETPGTRAAEIYRYAYTEYRVEIARGATIEWTNRDDVMHTVSADDGSWNSGAIPPGARWRARFDEPGVYPFHCGPHPFMKGVVVVR